MIKLFHVVECGDLTGCGKMVAAIANRLAPAHFDVTLVYALRPGITREAYEGIFSPAIRKMYQPLMVRNPSPLKDLFALFSLWLLFRRERPDAVHLHSSKAGFLGRLAAFAAGVPRVFYSPYGYGFRMTDAGAMARGLYYLLEMLASAGGYVIGTSPCEKMAALRFAPASRVIEGYNAIDVGRFTPAYPPEMREGLTAVACGRITVSKRPEALVRLAARVKGKYPSARFVWIGSGSEREMSDIRAYAAGLGASNLFFTGWISDEERDALLRGADIFVHFSAWDALPLAVSEAMALGKPVLASEAVEQVEHGKTGYVAADEEALFDFFCELAAHGGLRGEMGRKGRLAAEKKYNIDILVAKLAAAYSGEKIETVTETI